MKKLLGVGIVCLFLAACGSGISGTYSDPSGMAEYTFKSNGVASMSAMGIAVEVKYKVEDGKVKLISPEGTVVMKILDDGSIEGPLGVKLTKKK